jgi:hypothetical protein
MFNLIKRLIYAVCDYLGDKHVSDIREQQKAKLNEDKDLMDAIKNNDVETIKKIRDRRKYYGDIV